MLRHRFSVHKPKVFKATTNGPGQFANNLHALGVIMFIMLHIYILCDDPTLQGFVSVCSGCIMFSQQFHPWAHGKKSKLSSPVVAL
ncbi:hypothetical protein Ddye_027473 [Dipteronia dyeriana]|uniref:Lipid desaturase domain-containing protein n=1 Tax=Dipteronia dyeriana TaxID=168575 RepID=A0AAD9WRF3_9ROSI|nr:hypothetical protein Ddye_027473 [Dipteronia dyeriana]